MKTIEVKINQIGKDKPIKTDIEVRVGGKFVERNIKSIALAALELPEPLKVDYAKAYNSLLLELKGDTDNKWEFKKNFPSSAFSLYGNIRKEAKAEDIADGIKWLEGFIKEIEAFANEQVSVKTETKISVGG